MSFVDGVRTFSGLSGIAESLIALSLSETSFVIAIEELVGGAFRNGLTFTGDMHGTVFGV